MAVNLRSRSRSGRWVSMTSMTLALVALVACSSDRPKPTPLETYAPKISAAVAWTARIGTIGFPLVPAVRDGRFYVASEDGDVVALSADTGAEVWRTRVAGKIAAGVGSDGRYASVVTRGNEVVVLDGGRELWRKRLTSSVVTPPLVAGERVFVMGVDRAVHAFDVLDGRRLWDLERPGDALTLAQASVVTFIGNTLLVGQGQKLAGVDPRDGSIRWEVAMASPRGSNEVERLADLIGPAVRVGSRACARSFQAAVACADVERGALLWSRNVGGIQAVGSDAERIYGADASDRISAWRALNGEVAWTSEKLLYRGLSGALAVGPSVVFGDREGFVHFLSSEAGEQQLRLPTDGSAVVGTPALSGNTLLVATRKGGLYAFRP
ncbi:MAG: outer membrane protein assembly factor BamB [Rubrivivax sp.]